MLVPTPEAAYEVCKDYMPDCSKPIGYLQQASVAAKPASASAKKRQSPLSVTGSETVVHASISNGSTAVCFVFTSV